MGESNMQTSCNQSPSRVVPKELFSLLQVQVILMLSPRQLYELILWMDIIMAGQPTPPNVPPPEIRPY